MKLFSWPMVWRFYGYKSIISFVHGLRTMLATVNVPDWNSFCTQWQRLKCLRQCTELNFCLNVNSLFENWIQAQSHCCQLVYCNDALQFTYISTIIFRLTRSRLSPSILQGARVDAGTVLPRKAFHNLQ
jgi:hypothetical protein